MRKHRIVRGILAAAAGVFLAAGCGGEGEQEGVLTGHEEPVRLVYYTIGEPDEGLGQVEDALNVLLLERYGFTVSYNRIGWNDYEAKLDSLFSTNGKFDIAFAWTDN